MEPSDPMDQVRPLPPPLPAEQHPPGQRPRWPIAVAISAGLVLAFTYLVSTFEGDQPATGLAAGTTSSLSPPTTSSPPPTTTATTTTTLRPGLAIPELTAGVRVVVFDGAVGTMESWAPGAGVRLLTPMSDRPDFVEFNASGQTVALLEFEPRLTGSLHTGLTPGSLRTQFVRVTSAAWHETDPSAIAFTATLPFEEAVTLLTGTIDPLSFDLTNLQRVVDVPDQSSLTAWGDWGFAFADFEEGVLDEQGRPFTLIPRVIVLDPGGETAGEADGSLVDVAPGGQLLVSADLEERGEADGTRIMALTSPTTWIWPFGQEQLDSADRRPSFPVSPHALRLLPDGETVVALLPSGAGASQLTVESPGRSSIFSLEGALRLVDATGNGRFVVLHDVPALELVVVDLMLDEVHRLPVGAGRIIAVDIR